MLKFLKEKVISFFNAVSNFIGGLFSKKEKDQLVKQPAKDKVEVILSKAYRLLISSVLEKELKSDEHYLKELVKLMEELAVRFELPDHESLMRDVITIYLRNKEDRKNDN